ncbi:MAG: hypothetical protein KA250_18280 [Verrucomicrobiales bacterium]|jgi:hypothetical protein|nr:hypothetical protein [Verrucomicrobiales bacterium]
MQTEESRTNPSLESDIQQWTALKSRIDEFVKETKESGKDFEGEVFDELAVLIFQFNEVDSRVRSRIRAGGVIDGLPDESTRRTVQALVEKNVREAVDALEEEDRDFDPSDNYEAGDFAASLGSPEEQYFSYHRTASIVSLAEVPRRIHELLKEARICYAIGQSNAVMALGRMILEYTITDIGVRIGRFPEPDSLSDFYRAYPPHERADKILGTGGPRRDRFRRLYDIGSKTIHSSRDSGGNVPLEFLEEVIAFVNNEYAINLRA